MRAYCSYVYWPPLPEVPFQQPQESTAIAPPLCVLPSLDRWQVMTVSRPRPLRSTTLLSGLSSISHRPAMRICLRKSMNGQWTLIEPVSHQTLYHVSLPTHNVREIRRGSSDGALVAVVSQISTSSQWELSFPGEKSETKIIINPPRRFSLRGRHRFRASGRQLYWKWDIVCREHFTRRVFADTDGDTLLIYEEARPFLDIIVTTFLTMKFKRMHSSSSWISNVRPLRAPKLMNALTF